MTARKHLKQLVRSRMEKTGESYASARRRIVHEDASQESDSATRWHFPGSVPGATALRILLSTAGIRDPRTNQPFSEAMAFGIAGGIGIGVFAFYYEKEDFASFFIAGRHLWQDDQAYLESALERFGVTPVVAESGGSAQAAKQLAESVEKFGPTVAWVDAANLPHRAMPEAWSGGGYHIVVVYEMDSASQTATIGDLTDDPISISFKDLDAARARIRKQKNRILAAAPGGVTPALQDLISQGLRACHLGLTKPQSKGAPGNFKLDALKTWAERLHGSAGKESWDHAFKPGVNLWRGLTSIYDFIEHYGTGGGLCRPLFADFLREVADSYPQGTLTSLADRYEALGLEWSRLADSALPDDVPMLREAKELLVRKAELLHTGAPAEEVRGIWTELGNLQARAAEDFPLTDSESAELRAGLKTRVLALHREEESALAEIGRAAQ